MPFLAVPARAARILTLTLWAGALGVAGASLLGWLGAWWWRLGLLEHFRVQYAVLGLAVALAALVARRWHVAGLAGAVVALNVVLVAPAWIAPAHAAAHGQPLSLVVLNVLRDNREHERVARFLAASDADVIGLLEVDARWLAALEPVTRRWPYRVTEPRGQDKFGLALYSKRPLRGARVRQIGVAWPPALVATLDLDGAPVTLVLAHPPPPVSAAVAKVQERFFEALATLRPSLGEHVVVMGDLNATPWSSPLRRLRARTGLRDSRDGFGLGASWPTASASLRIPIDHLLVSAGIEVLARGIGPEVGSDHFPVRATIALGRR